MQTRPMQADYFRWGGLAALVAGGLGIVLNLLHPRTTENVGNVRSHLDLIAGSDIWKFDHAGLAVAVAIGVLGVIAIALSMGATDGDAWARTWLIFTVASSAVLLVFLAVDGSAIKSVADRWTAGGDDPGTFAAAAGIEALGTSLFALSVFLYFGVAPLLLGMAITASRTYPKAITQVAFVAGALGLLTALLMWVQGTTVLSSVFLFPIASLLGTVALMWAGWELYKDPTRAGFSSRTATIPKSETPVTPGL